MNDQERTLLMTTEFDTYRRIMIVTPTPDPSRLPVEASVWADPAAGEFKITLAPLEMSRFVGKRIRKEGVKHPIRLSVSFPDSFTLSVTGKMNEFTRLQGYKTVPEGTFIFDVFTENLPMESVFREKTIPTHSGHATSAYPRLSLRNSGVDLVRPNNHYREVSATQVLRQRFKKSVWYAIVVFSLALGLFVIPMIFRKRSGDKHAQGGIHEGGEAAGEGGDRESAIRTLMSARDLSYDEAALLINMEESHLNATA